MSIQSSLASPPAPKSQKTILDRWLEEQTADDQEVIRSTLKNPEWRHVDLLEALVKEGMPEVADTTFGVWRKRMGYTK
ncbi:hypothetical protein AB0300_18740 [Microbacterium sp. NPDC078814]|uniref:hypothetical protein n=1 Tax=Microbacterium sp. NPDC078814 TaxID=3154767 RepID=UPI00344D3E7F